MGHSVENARYITTMRSGSYGRLHRFVCLIFLIYFNKKGSQKQLIIFMLNILNCVMNITYWVGTLPSVKERVFEDELN